MRKISSKTFNRLSTLSDAVFFLSIAGLIYYSTAMGDSIKWEMALPIGLLVFSYSLLLKKPDEENHH
ncbi:hypothetical protein ACFOGI_02950 [Virgibacillus xinjiangensis]|uniref:YrhK-like protein n=1 Tax=Virgibacillus xinjiangensis TaxID=393090 RepID=A0ABV7CSK6_9BACI